VSKNHLRLSCAAIRLACKIKKKESKTLDVVLPVTDKVLQKNLNALEKNLANVNIVDLSQKFHGELR